MPATTATTATATRDFDREYSTRNYTVTKRDGSSRTVEVRGRSMQGASNIIQSRLTQTRYDSDFARSLLGSFRTNGRLSERQEAWLHILAHDAQEAARFRGAWDNDLRVPTSIEVFTDVRNSLRCTTPETASRPLPRLADQMQADSGTYRTIVELLERAARNVRRVRVRLVAGCGGPITLRRDGSGQIYIDVSSRRAVARINRDGSLTQLRSWATRSSATRMAIIEVLNAFNADPATYGGRLGQRTGTCCFCARGLSTAESVGAGYGPVCADRFGLPWGNETAVRTIVTVRDVMPNTPAEASATGYARLTERERSLVPSDRQRATTDADPEDF